MIGGGAKGLVCRKKQRAGGCVAVRESGSLETQDCLTESGEKVKAMVVLT